MIFILAGTYQQAKDAARGLPPKEWRYVFERRTLLGIHGGTYRIVGTFWERRDAAEIYDIVRICGLEPAEQPAEPQR